jgi:hypothetical protein
LRSAARRIRPTDGSDHARRAFDWLTSALGLSPGDRLRFLGVGEKQHSSSGAPGIFESTLAVAGAAIEAERRAALQAELSAAAQSLRARLLTIFDGMMSYQSGDSTPGNWVAPDLGIRLNFIGVRARDTEPPSIAQTDG